MNEKSIAILKHLSSTSCNRILQCLEDGLEHPDDIAKKLDVVRQTVDWHLIRLSALGMIDRKAESSLSGRPRVVYSLNKGGLSLIQKIDGLTTVHFDKLMGDIEKRQQELDVELARGDISEAVYLEKMRKIGVEREILK